MQDEDDRIVESIYDALDAGDAPLAHARARAAIQSLGEDPVLLFLAGSARLEMDDPSGAVPDLEHAVALDPDDGEFRAALAVACFRCGRFAEAEAHADRASEADSQLAAAHNVRGLLLERRGRYADADAAFDVAADLDPEAYPKPVRMTRPAFEAEVLRAGELLPELFREHLDRVAVSVEDVPADEILFAESPPLDPELLGLFVGRSLHEMRHDGPGGDLPPRIYLFQRNLERYAVEADALREEIVRTLHHEMAHYLGFEEDAMEGMDLD